MKSRLVWLVPFLILLNACNTNNSQGDSNSTNENTDSAAYPPVDTSAKVAPNQQPAFEGQTRIGGVRTQTKLDVSVIATGLNHPWGLAFLPDSNMIVSERPGAIRIVTLKGKIGKPIANVPAVRNEGDGGLLDIKLDPDFSTTRYVFWAYVEPNDSTGVNCVARGRLSDSETAFEDVKVIFRGTSPYSGVNHNGSRMLFDSTGHLYVTFGERFDDSIRMEAQQLNSSLGKIIRINKDGSAAAGNPLIDAEGALPAIFSYGHRNPQGLAINPLTGELWETEHGPQGGDELNIIYAGKNYGWPIIAYGLEYSGQPVNGTGQTKLTGMQQPVYYWDPSVAPSGMIFYTGDLIPEWKNNLLIGALKGKHIIRLVIDNDKVVGEERLLADKNQRFRQVIQGPDGAVYAITDEDPGKIYRIGIP